MIINKLKHHRDKRGYFYELWKGEPKLKIKQANISFSKKGVVRGIHFEPWDKYIHVIKGKILAVIVDLDGSYKKYILDSRQALFIPKGKGNSFQALEDTIYCYLTTGVWQNKKYKTMSYKQIKWPLKPIVSEKDAKNS